YQTGPEMPLGRRLLLNRHIVPQRLTLMVWVQYDHPDPVIAAKVANYFADAYLDYNSELRTSEATKAVDDLKGTVDDQRKLVERLARDLQDYKEKNNMVSLDQRKDIVSESLKQI